MFITRICYHNVCFSEHIETGEFVETAFEMNMMTSKVRGNFMNQNLLVIVIIKI